MVGRPLTQASIDLSRTKPVREKANRTRMARHPILWLKRQVLLSKMPTEVRARVEKLFENSQQGRGHLYHDDETAQREAFRLASLIHWTRATHRLLNMDPGDKAFMTVSKVTAQWTLIDAKLNTSKAKKREVEKQRRSVPSTSSSQPAELAHEVKGNAEVDGEDAP